MRRIPRWTGLMLIGVAAASACSRGPGIGEVEETPTATEDVPAVVREGAESVARRIGEGHCQAWFYDNEDLDWECEYVGLTRSAELDISPDGSFSELELVYPLPEVEAALADESAFIRQSCRTASGILIELSLRNVALLDDIPDLAEAWAHMSGVVLEFQCPNGLDFEIDARHKGLMKKMDDKQDAESHGQPN